jgi:hypothetical protein
MQVHVPKEAMEQALKKRSEAAAREGKKSKK